MGWFKRHKVKDFVSPLQEKREALGDSMKDLLDGRTIVDGGLKRNLWFILYLAGLGLAYISVGYYTEGLYMRRVELEREVRDLRFESITTASELMGLSVQSEVERRVEEAGLGLKRNGVPPVKIVE